MRHIFVIFAAGMLAACVRAEVVTAGPDEIAISAQSGQRHHVAAGKMAESHCNQTGRRARLAGSNGTGSTAVITSYGGGLVSDSILRFECY